MISPLSNKPKITADDIEAGVINRYFLRNISTKKITEVDEKQYQAFTNNPYYQAVIIPWTIGGNALDITTQTGYVIRGAIYKNTEVAKLYDAKMPGINRLLYNPQEFFVGKT
jgi:hypothetical protein